MATQTGSIDLKAAKVAYDTAETEISNSNGQITAMVRSTETNINNRTEAALNMKIDRSIDSGDLVSNINAIADQITLNASRISLGSRTVADNLQDLNSAINIDTSIPLVRIGNNSNNIQISNNRLELIDSGNAVAFLEGNRFKTDDINVTNLYMKTYDASTNPPTEIGALGWVMRSNGHLSLRRLK